MTATQGPEFGLGRGEVFPASKARSLLNPARRLVQSPRRTVAAIGLEPHARVVELGCGPGFFSPGIVRATSGPVVLLDLQSEMLRMARDRVGASSNAAVVQSDGARLALRTASFDAVFIATVLGEIPDRDACLADVRRILRPTGVLAIAETRRDSDFFSLGALRALVEAQRFAFDGRRGPSWQYVARFRRV